MTAAWTWTGHEPTSTRDVPSAAARNTSSAKVLGGSASSLAATEEHRVGAGRGAQSELVEGQGLAASLEDAGAGAGRKVQRSDAELGNVQQARIIGDSADHDADGALLLVGEVDGKLGGRDGRAVDAAHAQTVEHELVELGVRAASKEAVQLWTTEGRQRRDTYERESAR